MLFSPKVPLLLAFFFIAPFFAHAEDRAVGTDPLEPQFKNPGSYPKGMTGNQLMDLPLSDPKLRLSYFWLIRSANGGPEITDQRTPEMVEVLKDVKRRGDSATPLWLDIMANNHDSHLECMIPHVIARVETINMTPYVDYLRKMIQTRGDTINGTACEVALDLFFKHGNKEDVQMVEDLARKRPFLAPFVQTVIEQEGRRHAGPRTKPSGIASSPAPSQAEVQEGPDKDPQTNRLPPEPPEEPASSTALLVVTSLLIVAAIGLFRFWPKRRK
jgi:hypothetical protein